MNLEQIIFYLAIGSSILFAVQVLMSFFIDLDVDFDFDSSVGVSDFLSFKGGLHFLLGFSWMGVLNGISTKSEILFAVAVGIVFVLVLAFVYHKIYSLAQEKAFQNPDDLKGLVCELITFYNGTGTVSVDFDGRRSTMNVLSQQPLKSGDLVKVTDYKNGFLIVEKNN